MKIVEDGGTYKRDKKRGGELIYYLGFLPEMGYDKAMITNEDVQKLATLARIEVKDNEVPGIRQKMEGILAYVSEVQDLAKEEVSDMSEAGENHNVFRDDIAPHEEGMYTESLIRNAPDKEGNYIKVRKIL